MKMKSIKIIIALLLFSTLHLNKLTSSTTFMSNAVVTFYHSNPISGPKDLNFKGKALLDSNGKGIVIASAQESHSDALLRLVSEKLDNDSYLVDYRLMRSCDIETKITNEDQTNLSVSFSPRSMENRNKNDSFDLKLEIYDYKFFLPARLNTHSERKIKDFLKIQCEARKAAVAKEKENFANLIKKYHEQFKMFSDLNKSLRFQSNEVENLKTAISDTENQIKDINYLQKNYELQLKSIKSLTIGSSKLIATELAKKEELLQKLSETDEQISKTGKNIQEMEDAISKNREQYTETIEKAKDIENFIINYQRDLTEIENLIANTKSSNLRLSFDLKFSNEQKKQNEQTLSEILIETEKFKKLQSDHVGKIEKIMTERKNMESEILTEKEEIKKLEDEINQLILKKSKKEEGIKRKYDIVKLKESEISSLTIEMETYLAKIKKLADKKDQIESVANKETERKIHTLTKEIEGYDKESKQLLNQYTILNTKLKLSSTKKDSLNASLGDLRRKIKTWNDNIRELKKIKGSLDKARADLSSEIKDKESKLENLQYESTNYKSEVENVKKSLKSAKINMGTFNSILSDFNSKLVPIQGKLQESMKERVRLETEVKASKGLIKEKAHAMKNDVKSATVMIDLAEDEAFNVDEDTVSSIDKNKYQELIDKIIC